MGAFCGSIAWTDAPENLSTIASAHRGFGPLTFRSSNQFELAWCKTPSELQPVSVIEHRDLVAIGQFDGPDDIALLTQWVEAGAPRLEDLLSRFASDFALAIFDRREGTLLLARAPLSSIPLAYLQSSGSVAFATLASSLHRGGDIDVDYLAQLFGTEPVFGTSSTAFKDVRIVLPGTAVRLTRNNVRVERYWSADRNEVLSDRDASTLLRRCLNEAVGRDIQDYHGQIATHLSGGRDSGVVTATAALSLASSGRRVLALTAAPDRSCGAHYDVREDEELAARSVTDLYPNVDHEVFRVRNVDLGALLDRYNRNRATPYGAPVNLPWWDRSLGVAAEHGCRLLLSGVAGNLTVSAGGPDAIVDLLRTGKYGQWLRAILHASRFARSSFRSLFFHSLAPWLPTPVVGALRKAADRPSFTAQSPFLGKIMKDRLVTDAKIRPFRNWELSFQEALEANDDAEPNSVLLHGVTVRDPLADREVVEAVLKIRPDAFASPWDERTIFEKAFGDRLPRETLRPTVRGAQAADWHTAIDPAALLRSVEGYARNPLVREFVDTAAVLEAIKAWPSHRLTDPGQNYLYPYRLLPAVSLASFLDLHYPA